MSPNFVLVARLTRSVTVLHARKEATFIFAMTLSETLAETLKVVCKDVRIEPQLLPVTGEVLPAGSNIQDGARSDISAVGLWQPLSRAF